MPNVFENIEEYNPNKKHKIIIDFDEMIGDIPRNKKLDPTVTELVIRLGNWNIYFVFLTESYFGETKSIRLDSTH